MVPVGSAQMLKLAILPPIGIIFVPLLLLAVFSLLVPLLTKETQRPPGGAWRGPFYSNPDDPALFVPKRYGIGYTLNFGNGWSWVVLALVLATVLAPILLSTIFLPRLPR
jgi:uncharacterized membrane protein